MERPVKRQKIALDSLGTDDEDELDCEPDELNQRRDPVYQLEQARARASNKLKSRFEDIFAKYGRDFTGVGDEIDLRTGRVVVNNGHLQSITGIREFGECGQDEQEDVHFSENDRSVHGISDEALRNASSDTVARGNPRGFAGPTPDSPWPAASIGGTPGLPSTTPPDHEPSMPPSQPLGLEEMVRTQVVDPAWQAPELPQSAFMSTRFVSQAQQRTFGTGHITRVTRGSLVKPRGQDGDEEDVLLGAPDNVLGTNQSPLIKSKFPAVGSSPNNDPGLHEMIQDVIENIATTSPAAEQSRKWASGTRSPPKPSMKPVSQNADKYCIQGKKTSVNCKRSAGKPTAVSPSRTDEANRYSNKERAPQTTIRSPAHAVTKRKTTRRRRQPKAHTEQRTTGPKGESDASGMDEDFLDITGNTPLKPAGQTFYVEIKARKVGQTDLFAQDHDNDELNTADRSSLGVDVSDQTQEPPLRGPLISEEKPARPPSESRVSGAMKRGTDRELSQRKQSNPVFASTGADNLPTRKPNGVSAPAEIDGHALQESQPSVPQKRSEAQFERNIVDPSYTFSDDENLLPRRERNIQRNSGPASRAGLAAQGVLRLDKKAKARKFPPKPVALDTSDQGKQNRAARTLPQPIVEHDAAIRATETSNPSQEQSLGHLVSDSPSVVPMYSSHRRTRRNWPEEPASEQPRQQATAEAEPRSLSGRYKNKPGHDRQGSPGLGQKSSPAVASLPAVAKDDATSEKPPKTAESSPPPPSTPQPKSKSRSEKAGAPRSGLISLLSDDDDEEDEISFNLADFTPSGHHRILALRLDANLPATASTGENRRVASLLFGPTSTSKASRHSTPGCDSKNRKRRRRSTNTLAGSVVKVGRDSTRAPSPVASVVQTPGGTKRRCGEDGFRCERDFCFVCISI
ncbi:hypothetical protein F5883DRAFT_80087 [Diaporthe sp. PMI_573]|nr:hypothetical protein F5883DRAFT_80087 [Diaporthaceae sp. PMI_573]